MRPAAYLVCLSMFLTCFTLPSLGWLEFEDRSASRWNSAESSSQPCTDTVRAAQFQRIWLEHLKSRLAVACEPTSVQANVVVVLPFEGESPRTSAPTQLAQRVRLQL